MARVLVAMSGGVDSSVAALLLARAGHECVGATMLLHGGPSTDAAYVNGCCSLSDVEDARAVAAALGIEHRAFDFTPEFERLVVDDFCRAYEQGLTPNPCARCNRHLKFGALARRALELGCDFVATGHYARVEHGPDGTARLYKAADRAKDQSYFLSTLTQPQLRRALTPLGGLDKGRVREMAREAGLPVAEKPESQDVCFIPDGDCPGFLERHRGRPFAPGDVLDPRGRAVGRHRGAALYTIGQRKGLGVSLGSPVYVVAKDMGANTVTVGPASMLEGAGLVCGSWNWQRPAPEPGARLSVRVRCRYRQHEQPAVLEALEGGGVRVSFESPQPAAVPGQVAVAYDGELVLGAGVIDAAEQPAGSDARAMR